MRAELLYFINDLPKQDLRRQFPMPPQRSNQTLLSEFLFGIVEGFSYPIGVERKRIPGEEFGSLYRAIPFFEDPQYGACGMEPFDGVVAPNEKSGDMPAIGVAQTPRCIVIFGKEERCVSAVG